MNRRRALLFVTLSLTSGAVFAAVQEKGDPMKPVAAPAIPGYDYASAELSRSPVTLEELELLKSTVLFGEEDERALRRAGEILGGHVEEILDTWYGFVGSHPHLLRSFGPEGGEPNTEYLASVRRRFAQWILDTCERPFDRAWLDWQEEIALRHHRSRKNRTDGVDAEAIVPGRYLVAFVVPITATIRPFLARGARSPEELEQMHQAWFKAVTLSVTLWTRPYFRDGDF